MTLYKYKAENLEGKKIKGQLEANSEEDLYALVRKNDFFITSSRAVFSLGKKKKKRLNDSELADFAQNIGTMIASGVSLIRAMNIMINQTDNPKIKEIYKQIYISLQKGSQLSAAMADQEGVFPDLITNMFLSGESSGKLDKVALTMSKQYEKDAKLKSRMQNASMYPMILLFVTVIVVIILFTFVVPQFVEIYGNIELPLVTRICLGISNVFVHHTLTLFIGFMIFIVIVNMILSNEKVKYKIDVWKLKLPVVGKLMVTIYTSRFARTMCSLYISGVGMLQSLEICQAVLNNRYIKQQFDEVIREVRNGANLSTSIQKIEGFAPRLSSSIYVGEESGQLDVMLENLSNVYDYESEQASQRLVTLMEPAMIIILAIVVGGVIVAVLVPMLNMYGNVG